MTIHHDVTPWVTLKLALALVAAGVVLLTFARCLWSPPEKHP